MKDQPVILITGASRGIGLHLVQHFLDQNWLVCGCSRSESAELQHPNYSHFITDVSVETQVVELFRSIRETHARLDSVINCAAINPTLALTMLTPFRAAEQTIGVNFLGTFVVCREAAKLMMRRKFGRIVNFGSMAVRHEVPGESLYTASKAAIGAFTRVLAKELYPHGITCNVVSPSAIETELMSKVDPQALAEVLKRNAIPQLGNFSDVTNTVDWLLRAESQSITGQTVYLGGA